MLLSRSASTSGSTLSELDRQSSARPRYPSVPSAPTTRVADCSSGSARETRSRPAAKVLVWRGYTSPHATDTRQWSCSLLAAAVLSLAACSGSSDDTGDGQEQLNALRRANVPYFYLGDTFLGLPVTHAEGDQKRGLVVYGDCEPGESGCAPPVQVQTKLCKRRKVVVAIFFGTRIPGQARMQRAKKAVRPLNEAAKRIPKPLPSLRACRSVNSFSRLALT